MAVRWPGCEAFLNRPGRSDVVPRSPDKENHQAETAEENAGDIHDRLAAQRHFAIEHIHTNVLVID